ncbi:MAG TPA: type II secretion system F family protein [Candidatus Paceibacterota bacterium]
MLFNYKAVDQAGAQKDGSIDSSSIDGAIANLQKQNLVIIEIKPAVSSSPATKRFKSVFGRVKMKDVVILSQQLSTLIGANVPILTTFRLVASETESPVLGAKLTEVVDDIQGGTAISAALAKHPDVFSAFYVSLVRASEESGKLPETFKYLADYLERSFQLVNKAKNALVYPIFVIVVFGLVMILMLVLVIPQLTGILLESGQEIPLFTKFIIGISDFFVHYGILLLFLVIVLGIIVWQYSRTTAGKYGIDRFKLSLPYIGQLYRKMFLSRVADNLNMMLESGIPVIRSLEVTADVVGNEVYRKIMLDVSDTVKGGGSLSEAFAAHNEFPSIMAQMARIGEETGKLDYVLKTLSRFYTQEVESTIDLLVGLIEPVLIVVLGLGVAILLSGILLPIYSLTGAL